MTDNPSAREALAVYAYFFRAYSKRTAMMVLLMFFGGVAEGVGVITLVPVLELIASPGSSSSPVAGAVARVLSHVGLQPTLIVLLSLIVAAITAKAVLLLMANRQVGYSVADVVRDLRVDYMKAVIGARWSYFHEQQPGHFANAVASEALRAGAAYREACAVVAALLQMMAYFAAALVLSIWVALGTVVAAIVLTVIGRFSFRRTRQAGQEQTSGSKGLTGRLVDAFQGIKPIKAMHREGLVWPLLEQEAENLLRAARKEVLSAATLKAFQEPILTVALALGLYLAMTVTGQPLSAVLVLAFIFYRLVTHINTVHMRYQLMLIGESAFTSLQSQTQDALRRQELRSGERPFEGLREGIQIRDLEMTYGEQEVLRGVTADIPAGTFVAVHGESGSGKTTLADLIVRLYEPTGGTILVDGVPLEEYDLGSWRRAIGYVPQEMLLFNDTILTNVTLGDPTLTRADAERALRMAGAWDFVQSRPGGLDSEVGDRGGMLSGGQRQRLAIARALVGRPSLLILDEVTTALDPETERGICQTLKGLVGEATIFSISHQPAMRAVANFVYELRDGLLVDRTKELGAAASMHAASNG